MTRLAPFIRTGNVDLYVGDALDVMHELPDEHVNCIVTSPPYWKMRNYKVAGQVGWELTPHLYAEHLAIVFSEARRVLRKDGVFFLNVGDKFDRKQLLGLPHTVRAALQDDGWFWRSEIVWHKLNVRPESARDRVTHAHEFLFMFTRGPKYAFDAKAIQEPAKWERWGKQTTKKYEGTDTATGWIQPKSKTELQQRTTRNKRSVWSIPTANYPGAHDAVYPEALVEPCILAGCPEGGTVLDPFVGTGTTMRVAARLGRGAIGIDLDKRAIRQAADRLGHTTTRRT